MAKQFGFFDVDRRLAQLTRAGDPLLALAKVVDIALFRDEIEAATKFVDRGKGGRPPWDAVLMLKVFVLQALYGLSDEATEYQIRDRLSFQRLGAGVGRSGTGRAGHLAVARAAGAGRGV